MSNKVNLVVVESNGKVATITKLLNRNKNLSKYGKFSVIASFGHIRDLPKKQLGIDIEKGFEPQYEILADKKAHIDKIIKAAKNADTIYIASDNDYDGTFIGESIRVLLNLGENYKRIVFSEITGPALQHAIEHPTKIDKLQLASQQCRRMLDRLVGFKLSPLLWKKFNSGIIALSAGRVQSAVMHLIIAREKEINAFRTTPYWHINANFRIKFGKNTTNLEVVKLYLNNHLFKAETESDVQSFFKKIKDDWTVSSYKQKISREGPDAPFITSSLQQEGSSKLKTSVKRIMAIAQDLYEAGHITYMRTDSYNMSETFKEATKTFISQRYGDEYLADKERNVKKVKGAQEAHECIRPTDIQVVELGGKFEQDHKDLYKLIWQRSIAYLMAHAVYDELSLIIRDKGMTEDFTFQTTFKKVKFNGYLVVYGIKNETNDFLTYTTALDNNRYTLKCENITGKNTWTCPPSRYNDAKLVKLMETNALGRPATYSSIIQKLYDKTYVIKTDIQGEEKTTTDWLFTPSKRTVKKIEDTVIVGAEQGRVKPTEIGIKIDEYLETNFDYIIDKDFTANMEQDLDLIHKGKKQRNIVLQDFWKKFSIDLEAQTQKKEKKQVLQAEKREVVVNNQTYIIRMGPYGPLIEYDVNGKKTFIGLKGYLPVAKKEYLDIDNDDIEFISSLPKVIATIDGNDAYLYIGMYGPYLRWNGLNVKIPRFAFKDLYANKTLTEEQVQSFINYALETKKKDVSNNKTKKKQSWKKGKSKK
jgi:DNA topoisomerase-1